MRSYFVKTINIDSADYDVHFNATHFGNEVGYMVSIPGRKSPGFRMKKEDGEWLIQPKVLPVDIWMIESELHSAIVEDHAANPEVGHVPPLLAA